MTQPEATRVRAVKGDEPYSAAQVAELLGLTEPQVAKWFVDRKIEVDAHGRISGAEVMRRWRAAPPRVRFSRAPITERRELAEYAGSSKGRRAEVVVLLNLMRFHGLDAIEALWELDVEALKRWSARDVRPWYARQAEATAPKARVARDLRAEARDLRPVITVLAGARGRDVPAWLGEILRRDRVLPKTGTAQWAEHPWRADIEATEKLIRGTQKGVEGRLASFRTLAFHLAARASEGAALGEALADSATITAAFRDMRASSVERTGSWVSTTEKKMYEAIRPVLNAGAEGGSLSARSATALATLLLERSRFRAFEVPQLVKSYRHWARAEVRRAGIKSDPSGETRPPTDEEANERLNSLADRIERAIRKHERRGLTLSDWRRWREWAPELRELLGAGLAAHELPAGGLRGGSFHAQQPTEISADDSFPGAVKIERIIVKRVAREGDDGITTSHDNRPYDLALTPEIECSTWTVLPHREFRYTLRQLLEWYLHACGQCLGPHNECEAAADRVVRWIDIVPMGPRWVYREAAQDHVDAREAWLSKNGEWLAGLYALKDRSVRFNPLWWSRDGIEPILQDGLVRQLATHLGRRLHRWRHYALLYLTTAYPLSRDEAARLIHMDPDTAKEIYDNPSAKQILSRLRARLGRDGDDEMYRELQRARDRIAYLEKELRQKDHQLAYLGTVYGPLPQPPALPAIVGPVVLASQQMQPTRRRNAPRGADAFAA